MNIFFIIVGVVSLYPLYQLGKRGVGFLRDRMSYPDLAIGVVADNNRANRVGQIEVKIAYGGDKQLVVHGLRFRITLRYRNWQEKMLAWLQLIVGFLTNDGEGLREFIGPQYIRTATASKNRAWMIRVLNLVDGVMWFTLFASLLFSPFGWLFLLLAWPYDSRQLNASDLQIRMIDNVNGNEIGRPILLKPDTEREFVLVYDYTLTRRHTPEGFPGNTRMEYIDHVAQRPWWRLPRAAHGAWLAEEVLYVRTRNRWSAYKVSLRNKLVRLLVPSDAQSQDENGSEELPHEWAFFNFTESGQPRRL